MANGIFLTGTGTDIGKTYIAGLITKKLAEAGKNPAYYKAAMSGNDRRADGSLIPGDALHVKTVSGIDQPLEEMCPYVYETAVSPHLASRLEGNPVDPGRVQRGFEDLAGRYGYITAEGSGGILCPIRWEHDTHVLLEDIIRMLRLPSLMVADAGRVLCERTGAALFQSGASAAITGNMLTTTGATIRGDREMLTGLGRQIRPL